jgi:hypothetical protein
MASNDMQVLMYKILKYVFRGTYFTTLKTKDMTILINEKLYMLKKKGIDFEVLK